MAAVDESVKTSVILHPEAYQAQDYEILASTVAKLLAPYAYLETFAFILELLVIAFALAGASTLRSSKMKIHRLSLYLATIFLVYDGVLVYYYSYLTIQALSQLPSLLNRYVLFEALLIQQEFDAAYGFWGSIVYSTLRTILFAISLGCFVIASFTARPQRVWSIDNSIAAVSSHVQTEIPQKNLPPQVSSSLKHKKLATLLVIFTCATSLLGLGYYYSAPSVPVTLHLTNYFTSISTHQVTYVWSSSTVISYRPYATYMITPCAYCEYSMTTTESIPVNEISTFTATSVLGVHTYVTGVKTTSFSTLPPSAVPEMVGTPVALVIAVAIIVMTLLVYGILYGNYEYLHGSEVTERVHASDL